MKITKLLWAVSVFTVLLSGCGMMSNSNSANPNTVNNANQNKVGRDVKPADFKVTAEELGKGFRDLQNKPAELEKMQQKYLGKTTAITGKICRIYRKNRGSDDNYINIYTEGSEKQLQKAIICRFQDDDTEQMEPLRAADTVTVQSLYKKLQPVGTTQPMVFENCVVVENR